MTPKNSVSERSFSIMARVASNSRRALYYAVFGLVIGHAAPASAVMGEDPENRGLVLAAEKGVVILGCIIGGACEDEGYFYRVLEANQIHRGGVIETNLTVPGLGFGSILSTEDATTTNLTDTLCWSGTDSSVVPVNSTRDCIRIFLDAEDPFTGFTGDVISAGPENEDDPGCAETASLFVGPGGVAPNLDYLVVINEFAYGEFGAVKVVTCAGVTAEFLDIVPEGLTSVIGQGAVIVRAHRGIGAYDLKLYGGGYCC